MSFSKRLKELREKAGLSQEALAEELNIPRTTLTHYENDDSRSPRPKRLREIADFFGVSVDYLIGRAEESDFTVNEEKALYDIVNNISAEELINKYNLTVDGELASLEEVEGAIAFIRSLRSYRSLK